MARFQTDAGLMKCVVFLLRGKFSKVITPKYRERPPSWTCFAGRPSNQVPRCQVRGWSLL